MRSKPPITYENALNRLATLCSASEQCSFDLIQKLHRWGLTQVDIDRVIGKLREYRFVDDRRFARAYAHDKLCYNGWGKKKIYQALMLKRIPRELITEAFEEFDDEEYRSIAERVVRAKASSFRSSPLTREEKIKVIKHALSRGFEYSLISEIIRNLKKTEDR